MTHASRRHPRIVLIQTDGPVQVWGDGRKVYLSVECGVSGDPHVFELSMGEAAELASHLIEETKT